VLGVALAAEDRLELNDGLELGAEDGLELGVIN
jgi:hypothetical protein